LVLHCRGDFLERDLVSILGEFEID
jgi:hypothetical protein